MHSIAIRHVIRELRRHGEMDGRTANDASGSLPAPPTHTPTHAPTHVPTYTHS